MSTSVTPASVAAPAGLDESMFDLTDDKGTVYPESNFDSDVTREGSGVTRTKPPETVDVDNGELTSKGATKPAVEPDAVAEPEDDDADSVGEPNSIDHKGRVRGPDGKFAKRADPPPDAAAAAAAKAGETGAAKTALPFRFRTNGETHEFEGATVDPESGDITIKAARAGAVREAMNALHVRNVEHIPTIQKITTRNQELETELATVRSQGSVKEAQAERILASLDQALDEPDDTKAVEQFFKLRESRPMLKLQAEAEFHRRRADAAGKAGASPAKPAAAAEKTDTGAASRSALPSEEESYQSVSDVVDTLAIEHEYRDITAEEWQHFKDRTKKKPMTYVRPATAQHAKEFGVQVGESVFDTDILHEDITQYVSGLREQRAVAKRREQLAEDRSRRTAPQVQTPPAVDKAPPAPKAKERGINSKSELDEWFDSPTL